MTKDEFKKVMSKNPTETLNAFEKAKFKLLYEIYREIQGLRRDVKKLSEKE